jgi:hypothetical protein
LEESAAKTLEKQLKKKEEEINAQRAMEDVFIKKAEANQKKKQEAQDLELA